MNCPLCLSEETCLFHQDRLRTYFKCRTCGLIFVPPNFFLSRAEEKARYLLHKNTLDDKGYIAFLNTFIEPLLNRLEPGSKGLDFGSGPNPVMTSLLGKHGISVETYDPHFADRDLSTESRYDFLICVETAEHFNHPEKEWDLMIGLVKPDGWLGLKTGIVGPDVDFASWHYKGDPTHVCFYTRETFLWIGDHYLMKTEFEGRAEVFFRL